jgi:DNA-directed RNA polymerase
MTNTTKVARTEQELAETQVKFEIGMKKAGIARFFENNKRAVDQGSNSETNWNKRIIQEVTFPLAEAIRAYIDYYSHRPGKPVKALAYIKLLVPEEAAFIALKTVLDKAVMDINLEAIIDAIGQKIEDQVRFAKMEDHAQAYVDKVKDRLKQARSKSYRHQRNVMIAGEKVLVNPKSPDFEAMDEWNTWGIDIQRHIGAALLNMIIEHVEFNGQPIFQKVNVYKQQGNKYHETTKLQPTDQITEWIEEYKEIMSVESPAYRPCIVPPKHWTNQYNGGYHVKEIRQTLPLVKARKSQLNKLTKKQMPAVYKAINGLQDMPWTIANDVLHVAQEIKRLGINLAMPQREPYEVPACPVPEEFKDLRGKELKKYLTDEEWNNFVEWRREATVVYQRDNKRKSKYLDFHRTMSTADIYKDFERLYFVYTCDSRGRIYAKSDTINPQGDDFQKGMIRFANGKALGKDGMYWLAVQGAGKWGEDKCSFDDRVKFIENMTDDIRDFIADPLTFTGWAGADKPWQFLNWAFEWAALHDWIDDGNKAEDFVSYVPCAQDGSCSGLQHYSAMLRDPVGGSAVNLVPGELPRDIYGQVAELTVKKLEELVVTGESNTIRQTAEGLLAVKNGINRSLTKPPVMTKTYGSTQIRCLQTTSDYFVELQEKENKQARAEKREPVKVHGFAGMNEDGISMRDAEKLCSKTIWEALKETVTAANDGMKFIQQVAGKMAKAGSHLEWETPTGFIVEQKELEYKSRRIKTQLLGNTRFTIAEETRNINVNKMKTSSAPNFVHSMDSSHLVLATNAFLDAGFTGIAIIHDDFGTHACDTPKLRDLLRQTFVDMYEENDVLADFLDYNEALLLQELGVEVPEAGSLNLKDVLASPYAFG